MSKMIETVSKTKKCTFCEYWTDLNNSNIKPKTPDGKIWEYESSTCKICSKGKGNRRKSILPEWLEKCCYTKDCKCTG